MTGADWVAVGGASSWFFALVSSDALGLEFCKHLLLFFSKPAKGISIAEYSILCSSSSSVTPLPDSLAFTDQTPQTRSCCCALLPLACLSLGAPPRILPIPLPVHSGPGQPLSSVSRTTSKTRLRQSLTHSSTSDPNSTPIHLNLSSSPFFHP